MSGEERTPASQPDGSRLSSVTPVRVVRCGPTAAGGKRRGTDRLRRWRDARGRGCCHTSGSIRTSPGRGDGGVSRASGHGDTAQRVAVLGAKAARGAYESSWPERLEFFLCAIAVHCKDSAHLDSIESGGPTSRDDSSLGWAGRAGSRISVGSTSSFWRATPPLLAPLFGVWSVALLRRIHPFFLFLRSV